eukprot:366286-Chlamydomonas_euryale.AAC.1
MDTDARVAAASRVYPELQKAEAALRMANAGSAALWAMGGGMRTPSYAGTTVGMLGSRGGGATAAAAAVTPMAAGAAAASTEAAAAPALLGDMGSLLEGTVPHLQLGACLCGAHLRTHTQYAGSTHPAPPALTHTVGMLHSPGITCTHTQHVCSIHPRSPALTHTQHVCSIHPRSPALTLTHTQYACSNDQRSPALTHSTHAPLTQAHLHSRTQ